MDDKQPEMAGSEAFMHALQTMKSELCAHFDAKLDPIQKSLDAMHISMSSLSDQITLIEQRVSRNEDNISDLYKRVTSMEKDNAYLKGKVEDLENQSRLSNLRFCNIPEGAEKNDIVGFLQNLISSLFEKEHFPILPVIERAYRMGLPRKDSGPRPIVAKLLNFRNKVMILRLARETGELLFQGTKIHIYPDFGAALMSRRREFDNVKKQLRELDIKYALQYPAILRVDYDGTTTRYRKVEEVQAFIRTIKDQDNSMTSVASSL